MYRSEACHTAVAEIADRTTLSGIAVQHTDGSLQTWKF